MCPNEEYLSAFLDGEITSPWDRRIEAHVEGCAACREKLTRLRSVSVRLRTEPIPDLAGAAARVKDRIAGTLETRAARNDYTDMERNRHLPFWKRHVLLPIPVFATGFMAILVLIASLFFFVGKNESELLQARNELQKLQTVQVYYPVQNPEQLLKIIQDNNTSQEIIQLPETNTFDVIGEPTVIYVKDAR